MSEFPPAWPTLLRHEGGYVNNPNDPGGATNYGISLRWLKAQGLHDDAGNDIVVTIQTIQNLTPDQAEGFYQLQWWDKYGIGRISDQSIATKLIDTAVNVGTPRAVRFAQSAVNALGSPTIACDGQLGPNTVYAINSSTAAALLHGMQDRQASYYRQLALNPKLTQFLGGWLNRAYDRV